MQDAMFDVDPGGSVEGAGQLRGHPQRVGDRRRSVSKRDVERLGGDVILGQIRGHTVDSGGHGLDNGRPRQTGGDQTLEFGNELMDALGRQVELKEFDGHEALAVRIERAKHGSQRAGANLMENPEWTEGFWRRRTRSVRVQ